MNDAESEHSTSVNRRVGATKSRLADNPLTTTRQRRLRGRPRASRTALGVTFMLIADWRRRASWLAQQASVPDVEKKLRQWQVPRSLWPQMYAVIGKQRSYHDTSGLSPEKERLLGELTILLDKPRKQWTKADHRLNTVRMRLLPKHYGRAATRQVDLSMLSPAGMRDGSLAPKDEVPAYLRGLWGALDRWGAERNGIALQTFRNLRAALPRQRPDDPLFASLGPARRLKKPQQHRR